MGWSGGTDVAVEMIFGICKNVTDPETRKVLYRVVIESLQSKDWDCESEVQGIDPVMDEVLREMGLLEDELDV